MHFIERNLFIKRSFGSLVVMYETLKQLSDIEFNTLKEEKTVFVVIDMVNGFAKEGLLSSRRIEGLVQPISRLVREAKEHGVEVVVFADSHDPSDIEFEQFPPHCIKGTNENEVVTEIQEIGGYTLIEKNTTNGYLESEFQDWLLRQENIDNIIVVGDCTDICVQQFAITVKKHFEKRRENVRVIVPTALVETYELEEHNADLLNVVSLYMMKEAGVEIVKDIKLGGAMT